MYLRGSKRERRELRGMLDGKIQPYPKMGKKQDKKDELTMLEESSADMSAEQPTLF